MADPKDKKNEEDKVAAAYDNISKKLESLRNGKTPDDEEDSEEESKGSKNADELEGELEEWKGPKKREEEGDIDFRRVKLKSVESKKDDDKHSLTSNEDKEEDELGEEIDDNGKDWKPKQNDPLDEEDGSEGLESSDTQSLPSNDGESEDSGNSDISEKPANRSSESSEFSEAESESDLPERNAVQPDTLDDLTEERPQRRNQEEDDYFIPNLKGTGQRIGNEYNKPIEREYPGESYQKSSMDNNDPNSFFSQHSQPQTPKRASKFHLLILVIIGIAVIGFTVYILKGGFGDLNLTTKPSPSPTPLESPSPTPTPTPEPDRAKFTVRVLNGSGKTGLAASVSAKLKELGYQVDKTGNATNSAFTQTVVRVKTENESLIPQIVKDLLPDFDAAGNTSLKDSDPADIEIILGAK